MWLFQHLCPFSQTQAGLDSASVSPGLLRAVGSARACVSELVRFVQLDFCPGEELTCPGSHIRRAEDPERRSRVRGLRGGGGALAKRWNVLSRWILKRQQQN